MFSWPNVPNRLSRGGKGDSPIFADTKIGTVPGGYTLVEILVALTLTLILMTTVVTVFGRVAKGISKSRNAMEQFDRERTAGQQLNMDLMNVTARPDGHAGKPEEGLGYLEIIEGNYLLSAALPAVTDKGATDYTVGQRGDMIIFTARNATRPFVGRYLGNTIQSDVAEIAWFLRGNRLHRRVLLVVPGAAQALKNYSASFAKGKTIPSYYNDNDISAHLTHDAKGRPIVVPNSLADLTKRENRFGHPTWQQSNAYMPYPFDVRMWQTYSLPTLAECSSPTWMANWQNGSTPPPPTTFPPGGKVDMWDKSPGGAWDEATILSDQAMNPANDGVRVAEDVVLTNVIGFDVKVWEPAANNGAGGYVDLGSTEAGVPLPSVALKNFVAPQGPAYYRFSNGGINESGLARTQKLPQAVYDTGCASYENEGIYHLDKNGSQQVDVPGGLSTNGFDDDLDGLDDDTSEQLTSPPYPVPLRGIQVKIRCFEPDSKQIREITIEHDFLPK